MTASPCAPSLPSAQSGFANKGGCMPASCSSRRASSRVHPVGGPAMSVGPWIHSDNVTRQHDGASTHLPGWRSAGARTHMRWPLTEWRTGASAREASLASDMMNGSKHFL